MLVDTHAHLTNGRLAQDFDAVLNRAHDAGVGRIICAGATLEESLASKGRAERNERLFFTAGMHPHDAKDVDEDCLSRIDALLEHPKCVALGEIGLDYHYDFSPRDTQRDAFARQLDLTHDGKRTIVIHTREAFDDTMAILRNADIDGSAVVFHSFTGGPDEASAVLDFGGTISYSGIATFKNADALRQSVLLTPADRILVETDSPYLSPEPVRKMKTNEPANVVHVARFLAELRGVLFETFAEQTTRNAERIFNLPTP